MDNMSASADVAIIGAGLSGLALALSLHQQGMTCTIFESRPAPLNIGGAVMLSPNALKILDAFDVYSSIKNKGYNFEQLEYKDGTGKILGTQDFGSQEKYGYKALRIYRHVLIDEILSLVQQKGITVEYGKKFSHVSSENEDGVTWEFTDGTKQTASLLVGADGIHSTVRRYIYPDLKPTFTGMIGVTAAVPTAQLKLPTGYHIPTTIMTPAGAFVIAPQEVDGSEVLIGKQKRVAELDRKGWEAHLADKEPLVSFLQENSEAFPEIVQNAVSNIPHDKINVWPFYIVPKLDNWVSKDGHGRVVILGDAAHAIPPSAGQGINQAFEDVYTFALLIGNVGKGKVEKGKALQWWLKYRTDRVERILELNKEVDRRRAGISSDGKLNEMDLGWLYEPDFKADVDNWITTN